MQSVTETAKEYSHYQISACSCLRQQITLPITRFSGRYPGTFGRLANVASAVQTRPSDCWRCVSRLVDEGGLNGDWAVFQGW